MTALLTGKRKVDQMMDRLTTFETFLELRVNEAAEVTTRIANRTADAVRCLQFEDIVRQIVEHTAVRIDQLEAFLDDAADKMHELEPHRIGELHGELTSAVAALSSATPPKPAVQRTMTTGSVELF
jgi:methyl-accepting chemotaxis protein